jgi:hypothetical protein
MPSADPILGDNRSCDALALVVVPRLRDLGNGFAVRRAMPNEKRQLVGLSSSSIRWGRCNPLPDREWMCAHTHISDLPPSHIFSTVVLCIAIARAMRGSSRRLRSDVTTSEETRPNHAGVGPRSRQPQTAAARRKWQNRSQSTAPCVARRACRGSSSKRRRRPAASPRYVAGQAGPPVCARWNWLYAKVERCSSVGGEGTNSTR